MGVLSDILRTARMECRVLSRHKLVRNANLAARSTDRGYFYASTGRSQLTSPGMAPAMQEARSLAIWLSPQEHALTILDEEAEVVTGEISFAGALPIRSSKACPGWFKNRRDQIRHLDSFSSNSSTKLPARSPVGNGCAITWPTCLWCRLCAAVSSTGMAYAVAD
jgi:hypothetical protein